MADYRFFPLDTLRFPIVARFYKDHYPAGKPKKDEVIWTMEREKRLAGAVRFRQFNEFQLLTGMLIDPEFRGEKLGATFLKSIQEQTQSKICYCLAYRYLVSLYEGAGFYIIDDHALPDELQGRYASYCNSGKDLVPMQYLPK
ncbi:GNAT family N-acetyltransferase [Enterovibrio norvegicus FF-33]|uniref:GNAT family N-acetyltransferase n=1 Tax=Enterovibrio norvegicus FF-454 TaxID=1185651 RepID=A0A1E5CCM0_9GAMM|nr:GNAT family N-acetyltransferase [Enterovibrio norvegicus]OEE63256.1 GNAT family N-acetyltransferase [Enterovibrio norvegicus FF-454]OEE64763.1 GNAT family N-acetyltransferase [Enterovibrio norvegicus FF-33]OEE87840.1 GNAT family N-acetyltransferase [Enterovibrio norvegicus FF-162]